MSETMIDLHCHMLPGVDDGPADLADSLALAQAAVGQGITHVLCTPHHNNGRYSNPANKVISMVAELQKELDRRDVPLTLMEGQEVRITGELMTDIQKGEILFVDLSNRYILIEFPTDDVPLFTKDLFFQLTSSGHVPIIVHPERNTKFREDPNRLASLIEMGALTQLTAPSIVGTFGRSIKKTSIEMMNHGLLHMVASDAHNLKHRKFYLKEAYEEIEQEYGKEKVLAMQKMARDVVNGDTIEVPDFQEVNKKRFGLFKGKNG